MAYSNIKGLRSQIHRISYQPDKNEKPCQSDEKGRTNMKILMHDGLTYKFLNG